MTGALIVDDAVAARFPDYAAVVLYARGVANGPSDRESAALLDAGARAARAALAGRPVAENPHVAACRRWSWRQCRRTQLAAASTSAYFLLERLPPHPLDDLEAAADDLRRSLLTLTPGATLELERIGPGWPAASGG